MDVNKQADLAVKRARIRQRRVRALELRLTGMQIRQIADELHVSPAQICQDIDYALAEGLTDAPKRVIRLEVERLDALLKALWPHAIKGKVAYVDRVLAIMERRAKLLGLDKPQFNVSVYLQDRATELAKETGLDPQEIVALAQQYVTSRR